jgi:hypothetical protein
MNDIPLKYKIINYLENKFNKSKINNYTIGQNIRAFHLTIPYFLLFLIFIVNKQFLLFIILFYIIILILFIFFDSCILTLLECKLCNDKFTIIYIFIEILGLSCDSAMKKNVTKICIIFLIFINVLVYYFRFIKTPLII